jgi:hypothetical protein
LTIAKKVLLAKATQGTGQLQRRDFAEVFEKLAAAGNRKRQAGPAGAANSAARRGRCEQCENP